MAESEQAAYVRAEGGINSSQTIPPPSSLGDNGESVSVSVTCGMRCCLRGFLLAIVTIGSLFTLILLCRLAEVEIFLQNPTPQPQPQPAPVPPSTIPSIFDDNWFSSVPSPKWAFYNFNYWIVLFAAPFVSWHAFRRIHHGSLPWFAVCVACLSYLVLMQYTNRIGNIRQSCSNIPDDSSVARRDCNIINLGFTGAFLVFSAQVIVFCITTQTRNLPAPTWDDILKLLITIRGTIFGRRDIPPLENKWDLFFRVAQLVLSFTGVLFWLIELCYFSNRNAGTGLVPFSYWYTWVVVFGSPALIFLSFYNPVHRAIPFLTTIASFIIFYDSRIITGVAAQCTAYVNDYSGTTFSDPITSANCNFVFVGFVGMLFMWLGMVFFLALAAIDVFSRQAEKSYGRGGDNRSQLVLRIIMFVFIVFGNLLWLILLGKTAQYISYENSNNPSCTSDHQLNCMFWYEWYWWQLMPFTLVIAIFALLKTPRSAVPFYSALLACIMFYSSQVYSQPQSNAVNGAVYVPGIQTCRLQYYNSAPISNNELAYCEMQSVGYGGIILIIIGLAIAVYLSAGRLSPAGNFLTL